MEEKVIINNRFMQDDNFCILNKDTIINAEIDNIYLKDSEIKIINDHTFKDIYNDFNNPYVLEKENIFKTNNLYINPEYYLNNQEYVDDLLCNYLKNTKKRFISIDSIGLIKTNIIDAIVCNSNIEKVSLTKYSKNGYNLTKSDYIKFKKAGIRVDTKNVSEELKDNFDDIIMCNSEKNLIHYYKYRDLIEKKGINLFNDLNEEEIENLKYINPESTIIFHIENYEHILKVSNKLKELGKPNIIKIKIENKIKFNDFIFNKNVIENNLYVETPDLETVSLENYLKFEKILYQMIKNTDKLSPFEKYIYAYNITKQFKQYKENEMDKNDSRKLYSLLINEYMVCVGYSRLFGDLLDKMGIANQDLSISVDTSYDNINNEKTDFKNYIKVNKSGHARRYIHIVDPKYNIDGYYVSDPTWDNNLEHDYYNHLAMTDNETTYSYRYQWINSMDVFNVSNINEYIEKMKKIRNNSTYNMFMFTVGYIIDVIKKIDKEKYNALKEKYNFLRESSFLWPDNITNLIYDLGEIILEKVNKKIDGDTIFNAVKKVYENSYGYSEEVIEEKLKQVRKDNFERHNKLFPIRYKIDQQGNSEAMTNEENKFESRRKL